MFSSGDTGSITAALELLEAGARVERSREAFILGGRSFPAGSYVVRDGGVSAGRMREIGLASGVEFQRGSPGAATLPLRVPRIGLYQAWVANMDAGWIHYLLDSYRIPFRFVTNAELRAGDLQERLDVLILPDQSAGQILEGHAIGTVPPDYVGGIGDEGVVALREFVEEGGHRVCNNRSCDLPVDHFHLPVEKVLDGVPADSFNCPGAILKAEFEAAHPLAWGMAERGMVFFSGGQGYTLVEAPPGEGRGDQEASGGDGAIEVEVVAQYPDEPLLLSGWMVGDERIRGKASALEVEMGGGKILLFGFNVHNRGQARATLKLLFNALLLE